MNEKEIQTYVESVGGKFFNGGIQLNNWEIKSCLKPISGEVLVEELKSQLQAMSLPEQLFGNNFLTFTNISSQLQFNFETRGALKCWKDDNLCPLKVKLAEQWQQSRKQEIEQHKAVTLNYDWTFTSSYSGDVSDSVCVLADSDLQIDWELLKSQEPILFFKDIPLYCSELDDNGICHMSVKTRVMPSCWFVLLRFWLRVDNQIVRLRENRFFCAFKSPSIVVKETKWWECSFEELRNFSSLVVDGQIVAEVEKTANVLHNSGGQFQVFSDVKVLDFGIQN
eukprot:TRINITY_DN3295_c1_g2_i2.p1 TRINITY_DN3295_c1_g2~~TRINITY_DN3295_c1_g2_i2.p1  ORF type:complete len:281 (-),score=31.06 TRINITY_DN3295_c1_g2_i2:162-1004(-)